MSRRPSRPLQLTRTAAAFPNARAILRPVRVRAGELESVSRRVNVNRPRVIAIAIGALVLPWATNLIAVSIYWPSFYSIAPVLLPTLCYAPAYAWQPDLREWWSAAIYTVVAAAATAVLSRNRKWLGVAITYVVVVVGAAVVYHAAMFLLSYDFRMDTP